MIITSLLDTDLYKLTMQQAAWGDIAPGSSRAEVEYKFVCRNQANLVPLVPLIHREVAELANISLTKEEGEYLKSLGYFSPEYLDFLSSYRFNPDYVHIRATESDVDIRIRGPWEETILFEVPLLATINELFNEYYYGVPHTIDEGDKRLDAKIRDLRLNPVSLLEFGTRRRFSKVWQRYVTEELVRYTGLAATSNVALAKEFGIRPVGTMAHEYLQAFQVLAPKLRQFQSSALYAWDSFYDGKLSVALTDVIGTDAFLRDFGPYLSKNYTGVRHDSGDPLAWVDKIITHYDACGIDPTTKIAVFSDSLTVRRAQEIQAYVKGRIKCVFGIGTHLTNDMGTRPLNIVIKMVRCNSKPVAKISDEPSKAICEDLDFLTQLKTTFHVSNSI